MNITLHCGGMPFNGDTIKTESLGGSETAAYYVAKELAARGHRVVIFTNSQDEGDFDGVFYRWAGQPSEQAPHGDRFEHYQRNTPMDACIVQRSPYAFRSYVPSNANILWLHDLAQPETREAFMHSMWNVDAIATVSDYHSKQIQDTWGMPEDLFTVVRNGVDLALYEGTVRKELFVDTAKVNLIYSSRPERGLEHLVREGGIMERLGDGYQLHVCGYDNTVPQMADFYNHLWQRCEDLPNVTNHGAQSKIRLAWLQRSCDLYVYPTEFLEVSCITAMEAMAAGTPLISSECGALPETCKDSGSHLIPLKDGKADEGKFVELVESFLALKAMSILDESETAVDDLSKKQKNAAKQNTWEQVAIRFETVIEQAHSKKQTQESMIASMYERSDIVPLRQYMEDAMLTDHPIYKKIQAEYWFIDQPEKMAEYYNKIEKTDAKHRTDVRNTSRYIGVHKFVKDAVDAGAKTLLDYGCNIGHYMIALAHDFPDLKIYGYDIAYTEYAEAWIKDEGLQDRLFIRNQLDACDIVLCAELLEHVPHPEKLVEDLQELAIQTLIITVPYGSWERHGDAWKTDRQHIWHFDTSDIRTLLGEETKILYGDAGADKNGFRLGSYVAGVNKEDFAHNPQVYIDDHIDRYIPHRQSVSLCMLVGGMNGDGRLTTTLNAVHDTVDEMVFNVDINCDVWTRKELETFIAMRTSTPCKVIDNTSSPIDVGFAEARNNNIKHAKSDWIFWLDSDEVISQMDDLHIFLRSNMYSGYSLKQNHISAEPAGILKVDMPCRLFRNNEGVKFFGVVHEHPEKELNKGVGHVQLLGSPIIMHHSYTTEPERRAKFDRNFPLLKRDRKENPDRLLGKFLWLRDVAQLCGFIIERHGGITAEVKQMCEEALPLWKDIVRSGDTRILCDALTYYTTIVKVLNQGQGIDFEMTFAAGVNNAPVQMKGTVVDSNELDDLLHAVTHSLIKPEKGVTMQ